MTHTVILDEAERDRRFVNHLNEILRHCRIGKVTQKLRPAGPIYGPSWEKIMSPFGTPHAPAPMFMDKCGCRVGSSCGNAACPHGMVVTQLRTWIPRKVPMCAEWVPPNPSQARSMTW